MKKIMIMNFIIVKIIYLNNLIIIIYYKYLNKLVFKIMKNFNTLENKYFYTKRQNSAICNLLTQFEKVQNKFID